VKWCIKEAKYKGRTGIKIWTEEVKEAIENKKSM
jgi:hypothetical protein